ncbi:MAG: hypothetical protein E6L00_02025 [Thaumarchaeota archaeon]|nr:MAG: hypothetical protein E6L00_02025 [Nitrososphaerota archaeon]
MHSKKIFATLATIAIGVLMMATPAFAASFLDITKAEIENGKKNVSVEIKTSAKIPKDGSGDLFGYGAFGDSGKVLAVTTHGGVLDSEAQHGVASDPVFHTHIVELKTSIPCASGLAVASASFETVGKLELSGKSVEVSHVPISAVGKLTGTIVSFTLSAEGGDICVNPHQLTTAKVNEEHQDNDHDNSENDK